MGMFFFLIEHIPSSTDAEKYTLVLLVFIFAPLYIRLNTSKKGAHLLAIIFAVHGNIANVDPINLMGYYY